MDKRQLKELINKNGGFSHLAVEMVEAEAMSAEERKAKKIPEGAKFFSGIASNGDLNRNGYIIIVEAWRKSIKAFMENPVVLLGHDMSQPIGRCTKMEITPKGLYVEGYVFDEYTDGRVGKGLITTLSTGHYTKKYDFLNLKTGQILTKQDFRRQWDAFWQLDEKHKDYIDNWVRRITETEIVEFSFVSIPANRKSFVTVKEELQKWYQEGVKIQKVAKTTENVDNLTVTKNTMHNLTETDLESYPALAEKYNVGDAINAEAWEAITGEKLDTKDLAEEKPEDQTAEKADETAASDDSTAENADDGGDTADQGDDDDKGDAENADGSDSEDGEDGDDDAENAEEKPETTAEKVKISKEARAKLKEEAAKAKANAEKLALALEGTTDGEDDEDEEKAEEKPTTEAKALDMEKLTGVVTELFKTIKGQQEQITTLTKALENVPAKKGLILHSQFGEAAKTAEKAKETAAKTDANTEAQIAELNGIFAKSGVVPTFKS